jgi:hypothetical protein
MKGTSLSGILNNVNKNTPGSWFQNQYGKLIKSFMCDDPTV